MIFRGWAWWPVVMCAIVTVGMFTVVSVQSGCDWAFVTVLTAGIVWMKRECLDYIKENTYLMIEVEGLKASMREHQTFCPYGAPPGDE